MKSLIVIPAYNEEKVLKKNILMLSEYCQKNILGSWEIVISDNNSSDRTGEIGQELAASNPNIHYLDVGTQGKGLAIKAAWEKFNADVYCFMDADLATNLKALPELIGGVVSQKYDVVVGSRFHQDSKVERSAVRKFFSRGYQLVLKILLDVKIKDLPCGFKAINQKVKEGVLAKTKNTKWFFDSELIIIAEKQGYKIKEISIEWSDPRSVDDKSRVNPIKLAVAYLKEVIDLKKRLP